jgi:hypothetical protein
MEHVLAHYGKWFMFIKSSQIDPHRYHLLRGALAIRDDWQPRRGQIDLEAHHIPRRRFDAREEQYSGDPTCNNRIATSLPAI